MRAVAVLSAFLPVFWGAHSRSRCLFDDDGKARGNRRGGEKKGKAEKRAWVRWSKCLRRTPGNRANSRFPYSRTHVLTGLQRLSGWWMGIKYGGSKRERVDDGRRWWRRKRGVFRMRTLEETGVGREGGNDDSAEKAAQTVPVTVCRYLRSGRQAGITEVWRLVGTSSCWAPAEKKMDRTQEVSSHQSPVQIPRSGNVQQARGLARKEPVPLFASSDEFSARNCTFTPGQGWL